MPRDDFVHELCSADVGDFDTVPGELYHDKPEHLYYELRRHEHILCYVLGI